MGAALKMGTRQASHPVVAWVMADRSDRLEDIWRMRDVVLAGADLVVDSRAAAGGSYGDFGGVKALGSWLFSQFARLILGLPVRDLSNAFRVFKRPLLEELQLERDDFSISPEMVFRARARGKQVAEVPTVYAYRRQGMSNFDVIRMGLVYLRMALRAFFARLGGS